MSKKNGHPLTIDLTEFNLDLDLKGKKPVFLHFNTPSRRFYLSLIALVVVEMKKRGKIVPIALNDHLDLLALINETVGGSAGSSVKENLLPRIYRKWKHALPNLEEAPLFKVLGRRKEDDGVEGKTYPFSELEKDQWANLFAYIGSEENVRLKFDIDKIGLNFPDIAITFGEFRNEEAWESFLAGLREGRKKPKTDLAPPVLEEPRVQDSQLEESPTSRPNRGHRAVWVIAAAIVLGMITLVIFIWKPWSKPAPIQVASVARMAYPLPDKPSIAILPFKNLSGSPKQEVLADGITESIIGAVSRASGLFVIASNSVFTYKGKPVRIQTVSQELGVRNVLEGTVQQAGERLRVNAQLIDATTGRHLWSERYDRALKDVFSVQDDISKEILTALRVKLVEGEQERVWARGTNNLEAYLKFLKAYDQFRSLNENNMILTRQICEEAIGLDPKYQAPYLLLGTTHMVDLWYNWGESPRVSLEKATSIIQKAVTLDPNSDWAHAALGHLYLLQRRHDEALMEGEKAIVLNPNGDNNMAVLGMTYNHVRRYEEAINLFKEAQRRNPFCPSWYYNGAASYNMLGRWDKAIAEAKRALEKYPDHISAMTFLAVAYGNSGRLDEGRAMAANILKIDPRFSLANLHAPYRYPSDVEKFKAGLRKVGIPENPPPT